MSVTIRSVRPSQAQRPGRILILLAASLLCLSCSLPGLAAPADQPVSPQNIPANAEAFITVRVADLLQTPAGKAFWGEAPEMLREGLARTEKRLGLTLGDLERVTVVVQHVNDNLMWILFTTRKPLDVQKVRAMIEEDSQTRLEEASYKGNKYLVTPRGEKGSLYSLTEHTLVVAPEKSLQVLLDNREEPRLEGPLAGTIKNVPLESHLVAATAPSAEVLARLPEGDRAIINLKPFKSLKQMVLSATLTTKLDTRLSLSFAQAASAMEAVPILEGFKKLAYELGKNLEEKEPAAARSLKEALDSMKISQEEASVTVSLDVTINPEGLRPAFRTFFEGFGGGAASSPPRTPRPERK